MAQSWNAFKSQQNWYRDMAVPCASLTGLSSYEYFCEKASPSMEILLCLSISFLNSQAQDQGNHTEETIAAQGEEREEATKPKIKSQ